MPEQKTMQQQMIDLLKQDLAVVGELYLKRVAAVIMGEQIDCSLDALATELLKSNIPIGKILSALLRCEWQSVQYLIAHSQPDNIRQQVQQFSNCIDHFNGLQEAVVNAADKSWQQSIDKERKSRVLAECKAEWLETGKVHCHNYFNEVPVTANVPFVSFDGAHQLHVKATEELGRVFSASLEPTDALISSPDRKYNLLVRVFQCKRMLLTLSVIGIVQAFQENRCEVRVQMKKPMPVGYDRASYKGEAKLIDLSCTGMGLMFEIGTEIHTGEMINCTFKAGVPLALKDARVCWVQKEKAGVRVGIKLQPDAGQRDAIYKALFSLQQQIAGRIHQLGKPTWMK